jgi:hypothetical protein
MTKKKVTIILFITYFIICIIASLIFPLTENMNYLDQFKEGFLFIIFIGPLIAFFQAPFYFELRPIIIGIILLSGNIIPIIVIYKKKKLFPFIIISIIFFCIYLFIGLIFFGIRKGDGGA